MRSGGNIGKKYQASKHWGGTSYKWNFLQHSEKPYTFSHYLSNCESQHSVLILDSLP